MEKDKKLVITISLPDNMDNLKTAELIAVERLRQAKFSIVKTYLKNCYLKFDVQDVVTGDSYQSISKLIATSDVRLNWSEAIRVCQATEVNATKSIEFDWRSALA